MGSGGDSCLYYSSGADRAGLDAVFFQSPDQSSPQLNQRVRSLAQSIGVLPRSNVANIQFLIGIQRSRKNSVKPLNELLSVLVMPFWDFDRVKLLHSYAAFAVPLACSLTNSSDHQTSVINSQILSAQCM